MLRVDIPDFGILELQHLLLDYNGTLAFDGEVLPGVCERLSKLADRLNIHVLTGDTFGTARTRLAGLPCELSVLPPHGQAQAMRSYVESLGAATVACIGNGRNDRLMLQSAALAIVLIQGEGAASTAVAAATLVMPGICEALDALASPQRLVATLRD